MTDQFTPVPGFEHLWGVNRRGDVFSYTKNRVLTGSFSGKKNNPYRCVVTKDTRTKSGFTSIGFHRLVAWTFIGPQQKGMDVNHKDGNKLNNTVENLEYVTRSQNIQHAYDNGLSVVPVGHGWGRKGSAHHAVKLTDDDVRFIRANYKRGVPRKPQPKWNGRSLAAKFGVSKSMIGKIVNGDAWGHVSD